MWLTRILHFDVHSKLVRRHEELLNLAHREDISVTEVHAFIWRVRTDAAEVNSVRDRDQLRAILRYWAGYVYRGDGTWPNTDLAPSRKRLKF